jgi:hypothetical protein
MTSEEQRNALDPAKHGWAPSPSKTDGSQKQGNVYLDGKKVGMILQNSLADSLSRPTTGGNGADIRVSPLMPGMMAVG